MVGWNHDHSLGRQPCAKNMNVSKPYLFAQYIAHVHLINVK